MNRVSLFEELKKGGYESALITTFNIDFPFYEDVVLRRMQSAGIDHHIVMVDGGMCAQAMATRPPLKSGSQYSLAPMKSKSAFHPKLLIMVGRDKGFLAVGSHNLTLSGYGNNLEITNAIKFHRKKNPETLFLFLQAFAACETWLKDYGSHLPEGIVSSFYKMKKSCSWLDDSSVIPRDDIGLCYTSKSTDSLWDQMKVAFPKEPVSIFGMSAFFDQSAGFIRRLSEMGAAKFHLAVQQSTVSSPQSLLQLDFVKVVDSDSLLQETSSYNHAKLLYMESLTTSTFVSGSANLSYPAWLADGEYANAEATLFLKGDSAKGAFDLLGFRDVGNANVIDRIPCDEPVSQNKDKTSTSVIVVNYDGGEKLFIPWDKGEEGTLVGYPSVAFTMDVIKHQIKDQCIILSADNLKPGEVVCIQQHGETVAFVVVHYEHNIEEYSTSGTERKLRHALGSLNTSSPDFNTLFSCLGRLMLDEKPQRKSSLSSRKEKVESTPSSVPDSLIIDQCKRDRNKKSGRLSMVSGGDIGLIMTTLLSNLSLDKGGFTRGLNEDHRGRNEEELVGQDDSLDSTIASDQEEKTNVDDHEIIHKRLGSAINKLDEYLSVHGVKGCHAALGVTVFTYQLINTNGNYVSNSMLERLFSVIACRLLSDKDPIYLECFDEEDDYRSDDWGRMLGYTVWLAYHSGVVMRDRLPLSATIEEKDELRWKNACWLYLAQRVVSDEFVASIAGELTTDSRSELYQSWYRSLCNTGHKLLLEKRESIGGFGLAQSPEEKAFKGSRLVADQSGTKIYLSSVTGVGNVNAFASDYLSVVY